MLRIFQFKNGQSDNSIKFTENENVKRNNKNRKLNGSDNIYDFMTNYVFIHT